MSAIEVTLLLNSSFTSLVMPDGDPRDGVFYLSLTRLKDSYFLDLLFDWPGYCAAGCVPGCQPGRCWWLCFAVWLRGGGSGLGLGGGLFVGLWPVGWGLAVCL